MHRSIVVLLLSLFIASVQTDRSALCFLTRVPRREVSEFAEELAEHLRSHDVDVFVMIDDNQFNISSLNRSSSRYLQIPRELCVNYGYENTTSLGAGWSPITSWDKALLHFAALNSNYSFVWLVEDDVFIPSVQAFLSLHLLYSSTSDLIIPRNGFNLRGETKTWLWHMALGLFAPPWSCSMVNIVGFSRLMLDTIDDYVQWRGQVPFHEFFFNTLALQQNLTMRAPLELSQIVYAGSYTYEEVAKRPNNFWHSVKNVTLAKKWRAKLINDLARKALSQNVTDLPRLCPLNETHDDLEEDLEAFLAEFERTKSSYSPADRRALRDYFLLSFNECQQINASTKILEHLQLLADLAYRLPETPLDQWISERSDEQRRLEEELQKNQQTVLELLQQNETNSSTIVELRAEAMNLTRRLTEEVRRQMNRLFPEQTSSSSSPSNSTVPTTRSTLKEIFELIWTTNSTQTSPSARGFVFSLYKPNPSSSTDQMGSDLKILLILFSLAFFTFLILCWKRIEVRHYLIYVMIYLCVMSFFYLI